MIVTLLSCCAAAAAMSPLLNASANALIGASTTASCASADNGSASAAKPIITPIFIPLLPRAIVALRHGYHAAESIATTGVTPARWEGNPGHGLALRQSPAPP